MVNVAAMGHNLPPTDAEILADKLLENSVKDIQEMNNLLSQSIPEVKTDDEAKKAADFIDRLKSLKKKFEGTHKAEKAPYLEMGRVVDGFFKGKIEDIESFQKKYSVPVNQFLTEKAEAERKLLFERQEKARLQAEALAEQARIHEAENIKDTAADLMDAAIEAENKADAINKYATEIKSAGLAKIRTESGVVLSQRTKWVGEIEDIGGVDLLKLRQFFKEEDIQKAINAYVRDGGRELSGVKIYQKSEI